MQYLTKTIEIAATAAGSQRALEDQLGLAHRYLTEVKAGRRGLPIESCFKLAEMTGTDLARLIAESEAITAKKPEKVAYWKKKLEDFGKIEDKIAACLILGLVTNFLTPTPSQAAPVLNSPAGSVYIMSNGRRKIKRAIARLALILDRLTTTALQPVCFAN